MVNFSRSCGYLKGSGNGMGKVRGRLSLTEYPVVPASHLPLGGDRDASQCLSGLWTFAHATSLTRSTLPHSTPCHLPWPVPEQNPTRPLVVSKAPTIPPPIPTPGISLVLPWTRVCSLSCSLYQRVSTHCLPVHPHWTLGSVRTGTTCLIRWMGRQMGG